MVGGARVSGSAEGREPTAWTQGVCGPPAEPTATFPMENQTLAPHWKVEPRGLGPAGGWGERPLSEGHGNARLWAAGRLVPGTSLLQGEVA